MSKLVKKFDYNLNKNFYDAPFKAEPSTNRYEANKDLLYWLRFADGIRPQELSLERNSANATYIGNVENSESFIGNRKYPSLVAKANNYATFLDERINFYDFDTVDAFTASIWILPKQNPIFGDLNILNFKYEYVAPVFLTRLRLTFLSTGKFRLSLIKNNIPPSFNAATFPSSTGVDLNFNEWNNITFVYKKSVNPNERIVDFFVNGIPYSLTLTIDLDLGVGPGPLEIVNFPGFINNDCLEVAELATWNRALTTDEVQAIYNATRGNSWVQASGFVSDSPRLELRNRDHATGSYPARSAHGMPDFNGRYGVQYSDRNVVDFTSNYAEGSIRFGSTPLLNSSLHLTGTYDQPEYKMRFQFTDYNQEPWKDLTTRYVVPLRTAGEDAISSSSVIRRLKDAINDSGIGLEATLTGTSSISLRHHVPFAAVDNSIRFTNPTIRPALLDVTSSQFRLGDDTESKVYPTMLPASSPWSNSGAIFPHEPSDIAAAGRSRKGIADSHVTFTPGQDLLPFSDSRLDIDESRQFYSEGTPEDELPGFSARLSSKDSFVIDINPEVEHEVYFSTGAYDASTNPDGVRAHGGISYFNFHGPTRGWRNALQGLENANAYVTRQYTDYINSSFSLATNSLLSTIPSTLWGYSLFGLPRYSQLDTVNNIGNIGRPCSFAGFPQASKFDPTEEQKIRMSDYINGPFLLEKVVIEVSGVLSSYPPYSSSVEFYGATAYQNGYGNQVMIINTYDADINHDFESTIEHLTGTLSTTPTNPVERASRQASFNCRKLKDIVWYGRVGSYANDSEIVNEEFKAQRTYQTDEDFFQSPFGRMYDSVYPVKTNIAGGIFEGLGSVIEPYNFHTGTIRVEAPVRTSGISRNSSFARILRTSTEPDGEPVSQERTFLFGESKGGRKLLEVSSDRSYINGIGGAKRLADADYSYRPTDEGTVSLERYSSEESLTSPYVLMPTDELTIAWVNQPYPLPGATYDLLPEGEHNTATVFRTKLSPGVGRVTFYGSYLRDAQPLPPETSQPLTSNAVHEDVRDDASPYGEARCMDQFLVEPRLTYSGSYLDTKRYDSYSSPIGFIAISAGEKHTLGLSFDGRVYAWGTNLFGQLGLGDYDDRLHPTLVQSLADKKITSITAGDTCSFAVDTEGHLWAWGINTKGQLGLGESDTSYVTNVPLQVQQFVYVWRQANNPFVSSNLITSNFQIPRVVKVAFQSNNCVVAVLSTDTVLPDPDGEHTYTNLCIWGGNPAEFDFKDLDSPYADGAVYKPYLLPSFRPSRVISLFPPASSVDRDYFEGNLQSYERGKFVDAAGGSNHGMLLTERGLEPGKLINKVFTFGNNDDAQLGMGNTAVYDNIFKMVNQNQLFGTGAPNDLKFVSSLSAGYQSSFVVISQLVLAPILNIQVLSWGNNEYGQLGQTILLTPVTAINSITSTGLETPIAFVQASRNNKHTIAISPYRNQFGTVDSTLATPADIIYAWGYNAGYALGLGDETKREEPTEVVRFDSTERNYVNPLAAGGYYVFTNLPMSYVARRLESQYYAWGTARLGVGADSQLDGTDSVQTPLVSSFPKTSTRTPLWGSVLGGDGDPSEDSVQRFVRLFNSQETYYDSHVPLIKDIVARCNTNISSSVAYNPDGTKEEIGTAYLYLPPAEPKPEDAEVANWLFAFPFEPLFEGVNRSTTVSNINRSSDVDDTVIDTLVISGSGDLQYDKVYLETLKFGGPFTNFPYITPFSYMARPESISKAFYGFGDYGGKFPIGLDALRDGNSMAQGFGRVPGDFYYIDEVVDPEKVILLRGFKYGLINVVPMPRTSVFRSDRYGQFRDMLEQGQDSHFYEEVRIAERPARNLGEPAIKFRFISREDGGDLDPEVTNGQNLSYFATSSLPYFDGAARDRDSIQPDLLPRIAITLNTL